MSTVFVDNPRPTRSVATVSDLMSLSAFNHEFVQVLGYNSIGDGGGQVLYYDKDSTATIDGGFVFPGKGGSLSFDSGGTFDGTAGTGRYIAVDQSVADARRFGAVGDGVTDDWPSVSRMLNTAVSSDVPAVFTQDQTYKLTSVPTNGHQLSSGDELRILGNGATVTGDSASRFIRLNGGTLNISDLHMQTWQEAIIANATSAVTLKVRRCKFDSVQVAIDSFGSGTTIDLAVIEDNEITNASEGGIRLRDDTVGEAHVNRNRVGPVTGSNNAIGIQVGENGAIDDGSNGLREICGNVITDITADPAGGETVGIFAYGGAVRIENNYLDNVLGTALTDNEGIYTKSRGGSISNNTLRDAGRTGGISIKGEELGEGGSAPLGLEMIVSENNLYHSDTSKGVYGIRIWTSGCKIRDNIVRGYQQGIWSEGEHKVAITGNTVADSVVSSAHAIGIHIAKSCDGILISNNIIKDLETQDNTRTAVGIQLVAATNGDMQSALLDRNIIEGLTADTGKSQGIRLEEDGQNISNSQITANYINGPDRSIQGLSLTAATGLLLRDNECLNFTSRTDGVLQDGIIDLDRDYTVSDLPAAANFSGRGIFVSDGAAGSPIWAFSDGTNWLRSDTGAAVSGS